jgi:transposase
VGLLTALTLLSTVPELGTLGRNRIARLIGLAPLNDDSGKRFIQGERFRPRCALYIASVTASVHNPILRTLYQRLLKAGKTKKVALTALMRKLLVHLNSLMRQQLAS